jgi:hypothetical protein
MNNRIQIILGALTLIGVGIGVGAILVFIFLRSGFTPEKVSVGPVDFVVPTSQPVTPVVQPQLATSTTEPQGPSIQSLGTIRIFGNSNSGTQIQIPETGIYRFSYRSGAYSTYSVGNSPPDTKTWLTAVLIFRGDKALWDGRRIMDESIFLRLADMNYLDSAESAESAAQGQYAEAQLSQGDVLTLIGVDHFDSYGDNPGQVIVEWFLVKY